MLFRLFDSVQARRGGPEFNTAKASTISLTNNIEAEALGFLGTFARVGSVLKHELRIVIAELTRETPPHPHRHLVARIDRLAARSGRYRRAGPFLTPDSYRAIQSEPR